MEYPVRMQHQRKVLELQDRGHPGRLPTEVALEQEEPGMGGYGCARGGWNSLEGEIEART